MAVEQEFFDDRYDGHDSEGPYGPDDIIGPLTPSEVARLALRFRVKFDTGPSEHKPGMVHPVELWRNDRSTPACESATAETADAYVRSLCRPHIPGTAPFTEMEGVQVSQHSETQDILQEAQQFINISRRKHRITNAIRYIQHLRQR